MVRVFSRPGVRLLLQALQLCVSVLVGGASMKDAWDRAMPKWLCLHLIWLIDFQDMSVAIFIE